MANQDRAFADLLTKGGILPLETQAATGFTHRQVIDFTDINDAAWTTDGDTVTVALGATPTEFVIPRTMAHITTAFATDGTLTVQFGIDGDTNALLSDTDAKTAAVIVEAVGCPPQTATGTSAVASDELVAVFTTQAATGAPADITAGRVEFYYQMVDLTALNDG